MAASVMIQIRNVPAKVHRILKARAAMKGMSLSDYILNDLKRSIELPTQEEWLARIETREAVELPFSVAEMLAEERDKR